MKKQIRLIFDAKWVGGYRGGLVLEVRMLVNASHLLTHPYKVAEAMSDPEARNVHERALAQLTCLYESCASLGNITMKLLTSVSSAQRDFCFVPKQAKSLWFVVPSFLYSLFKSCMLKNTLFNFLPISDGFGFIIWNLALV